MICALFSGSDVGPFYVPPLIRLPLLPKQFNKLKPLVYTNLFLATEAVQQQQRLAKLCARPLKMVIALPR